MVYIKILFLTLIGLSLSLPMCVVERNFCSECHSITNLCTKCEYDILIPDEEGGCTGINKCSVGKNYCNQCTEETNLCNECEQGFYPDKNGGCSYTENCEISYDGHCIKCDSEYYLIGNEIKVCKYIGLDDFQNCKEINYSNGLCLECEEDYFLNSGDKKCILTEHCYKSSFGTCSLCDKNYTLNKEDDLCIEKNEDFINCKITLDGKECDECDDDFYFSEDGKCTNVKNCIYSRNNECIECKDDLYFDRSEQLCKESKDNLVNCKYNSLYEPNNCALCKDDYYLSSPDNVCKSNKEEGPFYKCSFSNYNGDKCSQCVGEYYIGRDDLKCNLIQGCLSSENEKKCLECDRYYVLDNEGDCVDNYYITDKEKQFYYYCKVLNEEGTGCALCENGLNATEAGICYDDVHCEKNDEGVCTKCQKDNPFGYNSYCLNEVFGCVDTFLKNCIRCDNVLDLDLCTECEEGYDIDEYGDCIKKEKNL